MFVLSQVNRRQASFRVNSRVVQMVAVAGVALAVPMALVVLAIRQFSLPQRTSSPDTSGLRVALEQAAEKSWHPPEAVADSRSILALSASANAAEAMGAVRRSARKFQGVALAASVGQAGEERLLVRVPEAAAKQFESEALRDFVETQHGSPAGEIRLYEFRFTAP